MSDLYILYAGLCLTGGMVCLSLYARLRRNRRVAAATNRAAQAEAASRQTAVDRAKAANLHAARIVVAPLPDAPVQWTIEPAATTQSSKVKSVLPDADPYRYAVSVRPPLFEATRQIKAPPPLAATATLAPPPMEQERKPAPDPLQRYIPPPLPTPRPSLTRKDLRRAKRALRHLPESVRGAKAPPAAKISERARATEPTPPQKRATRATTARAEAHPLRGTKYQLTYSDFHGVVTERRIRFERPNHRDGALSLMAYCYLRKEQREFRTDRIIKISNVDTGVVIVNPETFFV